MSRIYEDKGVFPSILHADCQDVCWRVQSVRNGEEQVGKILYNMIIKLLLTLNLFHV